MLQDSRSLRRAMIFRVRQRSTRNLEGHLRILVLLHTCSRGLLYLVYLGDLGFCARRDLPHQCRWSHQQSYGYIGFAKSFVIQSKTAGAAASKTTDNSMFDQKHIERWFHAYA